MTTAEKLVVQIFERKNWIIEQVKQQTELYNQHLASKLLINGVTPPSWLWNPNTSSHTTQLNKEELISELLLPHARHPVRYSSAGYSLYSKPVFRAYPEVSDGFCTETHASNKGLDVGEGPSTVVECHDIDAGNNLITVPELDGSVNSPVDQIDAEISNIYSAPDQSLAKIQRSKSRQRALELRNSAKSHAKSHISNEQNAGAYSRGIKLPPLDFGQNDHCIESPKFHEPCSLSSQISGEKEKNGGDSRSLVKRSNVNTERVQKSEISGKICSQKKSSERNFETEEEGCHVLMGSSTKSRIGDSESNEGDSQRKGKVKDIDAGRTARSRSSGICCNGREMNVGNGPIEEKGNDVQAGRITTPGHSVKRVSSVYDSRGVYSFAVIPEKNGSTPAQNDDVTELRSVDDLTQQPCPTNGSPELIDLPKASQEVCGVNEAVSENTLVQKDEPPNLYSDQITKSYSSSLQNDFVNQSSEPNRSSFVVMDGGVIAESRGQLMQQLDICNESSAVVRILGAVSHKRRRSENYSCNEQTSNPADNSSASGLRCTQLKLSAPEMFVVANSKLQNASDCQGLPDTTEKIEQQENIDIVETNELLTDKVVEDQPLSCRSDCLDTNLRRGLECLVARPPSDCFMLVKPTQLDFDNMEELNETLTLQSKRLEKSAEKVCSSLLEVVSPDKDSSGENKVTPTQQISSAKPEGSIEVGELWRKSSEPNVAGDMEFQRTRSGPIIDEHSELQSMNQTSSCSQKADVVLPKAVETPDMEISSVNAPLEKGCEFSSEQHAEEGECRSKEKDGSATSSYASRCEQLAPTYFSSLPNVATGDSQLPITKETGYRYSTRVDLDPSRQCLVVENQKLSFSGGENSFGHVDHVSLSNKITGRSPHLGRNGSSSHGSVLSAGGNNKSLDVPITAQKYLSPERNPKCYEVKKRKTEDQQADCLIASPSFERQELYKTQMDANISNLKDIGCSSDTVFGEAAIGNKSPELAKDFNMEYHHTESLTEDRRNKDSLYSTDRNRNPDSLLTCTHKNSGVSLVSSSTAEAAADIQGEFLVDAMTTAAPSSITSDAKIPSGEEQLNLEHKDYLLNLEKLASTERHPSERKYVSEEDGLLACRLVQSPRGKDPELFNDDQTMPGELGCTDRNLLESKSALEDNGQISYSVQSPYIDNQDLEDADQTMPVFEGFIIDPQSESEELGVPGDVINIDKLDLPRSTIARASILEKICKSASACSPLSHLSSALKVNRFQNLFKSVPNGLLEHKDMQGFQFLNEDVNKQFQANLINVNEASITPQERPYSDCLPCSGTQFRFTPVKQCTSPVGKFWEGYSSQSGSSGKRFSSNPELTCFPIEEDPSISEGDETANEVGIKVQEDIDSFVVNGANRESQTDTTKICMNPPASVSAADKSLCRGRVDSISKEASFSGTQSKVKRKLGNSFRNKGEGKENQALSINANGKKMAKESLNNRYSKPKLSGKASLKNESQKLSEKEPKRNNIVSNVTSFVPLVQQKQAAAQCTGKREIKVKALEAAEAVKRLEEKRENERKLRKEALKLERAKIEQENAKKIELNKKKKEEEQRRKDADIAARKRLREEEERMEKERKRKRIGETRRQQKEQEKSHKEAVDKEKQRYNIDGKANSKKESDNELKKVQNVDKEIGDNIACEKLEIEPRIAANATTDIQETSISLKECSTPAEPFDNKQVICKLDKSIDARGLVSEKTTEKSYEISPYQCSDDEDEESEELPTKKFIPSWASKNSVALALPLQQELDPDLIFPLETFCSMDEVLLPRKLQLKQVAM